jgi:hypothetical protein
MLNIIWMHDSIYLDRRHFYFCNQRQSLMILIHERKENEIYFIIILLHYVRCIYIAVIQKKRKRNTHRQRSTLYGNNYSEKGNEV